MDGYALLSALRAERPAGVTLPAIAVTAYARPEDRARAHAAGYEAHVTKPVEPHELVASAARLLAGDKGAEAAAGLPGQPLSHEAPVG